MWPTEMRCEVIMPCRKTREKSWRHSRQSFQCVSAFGSCSVNCVMQTQRTAEPWTTRKRANLIYHKPVTEVKQSSEFSRRSQSPAQTQPVLCLIYNHMTFYFSPVTFSFSAALPALLCASVCVGGGVPGWEKGEAEYLSVCKWKSVSQSERGTRIHCLTLKKSIPAGKRLWNAVCCSSCVCVCLCVCKVRFTMFKCTHASLQLCG